MAWSQVDAEQGLRFAHALEKTTTMVLIIYCYYGKVLLCICMYESALELCVHTRTNSPACAEVHPHPHRLACNCIGQRRIAIG